MSILNNLPNWNAQSDRVVEPDNDKKAAGWRLGEEPPPGYFNWFWNLVSDSLSILDTHNHDGRYYTKSHFDSHDHDSLYYRKNYIDSHEHDDRYYTKDDVNSMLGATYIESPTVGNILVSDTEPLSAAENDIWIKI